MDKVYIFVLIVILIIVIGLICMFKRRKFSRENFAQTATNLHNLKLDLVAMMTRTLKFNVNDIYQQIVGKYDEYKIIACIDSKMSRYNIPTSLFDMKGDKMNEPILKMHKNNPKLFSTLEECGFLTLVGHIVATAAWISHSTNKSKESLIKFSDCLDKVDFSNIKVWENIAHVDSPVMSCVTNSA